MYEELIKALHNGAEFLECSTPGIKNSFAKMCHNAADAIEELAKVLERSKNYEKFWNEEAEEALRRFQVAVANKPRWIPVTERLPESGKVVIGYNGKRRFVSIVRVSRDSINLITHWMPLPQLPCQRKEETHGD